MVDKKNDEEEAEEVEKTYNHYLDTRKEIMRNKTSFKIEDIFGKINSKDSISPDRTTKPNNFIAKIM